MLSPNQIQHLVRNCYSFIERYSAIMILSPDVAPNVVYSGTFVSCFGYIGILTAGHCASALMESSEFYLVIREHAHRLEVQPKQFFHMRIGYNDAEGYSLSEPDLSFLIIKDRRILNILIANSRFSYDMSKLKIEDTGLVEGKFSRNNWIIVGSAAEDTKTKTLIMNGHTEKFITLGASFVQGHFAGHNLVSDYGYDYVKLKVIASSHGFPDSYSGFSGGGIWYLKSVTDSGKKFFKPILTGVACWQSKKKISHEQTCRIISGHG